MTTVAETEVRCPACDFTRAEYVLSSTSSFGHPDLDGTPGGHARHALLHTIMRCPNCACCAPNGVQLSPRARGEISSRGYLALISDRRLPELARCWLCWSQISAHQDLDSAAHAALVAAWACDDAEDKAAAWQCRQRYIAMKSGHPTTEHDAERRAKEAAVLADVLRRSGHFDRAVAIAESELARQTAANVRAVFSFEIERARRRDARRYTLLHVSRGPGRFADALAGLSRLVERAPRLPRVPEYVRSKLAAATPIMFLALLVLVAWLSDAQCHR